jgi:hypothetical protein
MLMTGREQRAAIGASPNQPFSSAEPRPRHLVVTTQGLPYVDAVPPAADTALGHFAHPQQVLPDVQPHAVALIHRFGKHLK